MAKLRLLTKAGRITKNKWVVINSTGKVRIHSRHQFKSAAMDRARSKACNTGRDYAVGEISMRRGEPVIYGRGIARAKDCGLR
jgi:hypothetical protein